MTTRLPTRLGQEPLIDALFEMRFSSNTSASSILPGYLFSKLQGERTIERLPTEQIPKPILDSDPNLRFAPLVRLHWEKFVINISDRSLAIGCKMPYPGWATFKPAILTVVEFLQGIGIIQAVHRCSMKYIDLIPAGNHADQVSALNATIVLGNHTLHKEAFALRLDIPKNGFLHIIQINSSAFATLPDGSTREGVIVDTDTISEFENVNFESWFKRLPDQLESVHLENKIMFFECLRPETLASLEPTYDC